MNTTSNFTPLLSEQSLLYISAGVLLLLVTAGAAFTIILRNDPAKISAFRGGRSLHYFTIFAVVLVSTLLAFEGILSGEAMASILGGIIGYVLGTLQAKPTQGA